MFIWDVLIYIICSNSSKHFILSLNETKDKTDN